VTYHPDLAPTNPKNPHDTQRYVGYLHHSADVPTAPADPALLAKLAELTSNQPWAAYLSLGMHLCTLCMEARGIPFSSSGDPVGEAARERCQGIIAGSQDVYIPGEGRVYVVPELIVHYVYEHGYTPPQEFCDAVMACPAMNSLAYFEALERAAPHLLSARPGLAPGQAARRAYEQQQALLTTPKQKPGR
jgi:hypothetical protein